MFSMPAQVFKGGVLVAEDGHVRRLPHGAALTAATPTPAPRASPAPHP
jgi:hypothetical protein